eukprot:CAMPEP_0117678064 /NCGR_PEP_ID=MMETSP0804-20121206/17078_1 /TAXON_ID=1074897 /ORGANISM="Tetraselmis astigmatica, Strain CCMP880" /LENGTH=131 /DNA_ID=CAMNT_0005487387 /DNA_START=62 /DNA_END=457 /DNA_ORIENTATION=+
MAAVSDQLVWELVKGNNAFLRKNLHGRIFSKEPSNLFGKHSYKYSGIANSKCLDVTPSDGAVVLTKSKPTKGKGKPVNGVAKTTMKKDMRRMAKAVSKEVEGFRPDLKQAALAKLSAAQKSLRVIKAGPKK